MNANKFGITWSTNSYPTKSVLNNDDNVCSKQKTVCLTSINYVQSVEINSRMTMFSFTQIMFFIALLKFYYKYTKKTNYIACRSLLM